MNCKNCGEPVENNWVRCPSCSTLLKCPRCKQQIKNSEWTRCPSCDNPLQSKIKKPSKVKQVIVVILSLCLGASSSFLILSNQMEAQMFSIVLFVIGILILPYFTRSTWLGALTPFLSMLLVFGIVGSNVNQYTGMFEILIAMTLISLPIGAGLGYAGKKKTKGGGGFSLSKLKGGLDVAKKGLDVAGSGMDLAQEAGAGRDAFEKVKSGVELAGKTAELAESMGANGKTFEKLKSGVEFAGAGLDTAEKLGAKGDTLEKVKSGVELVGKTTDLIDTLEKKKEEE